MQSVINSYFSAHISTYGERVVDVFYVKDVFGMKVEHETKIRQVRDALGKAIGEGGKASELLADRRTGLLLGAHVLGPHASTIIQPVIQAMDDAPHALALLRSRHERPRRSRAAEQRDELASPHGHPSLRPGAAH